MLGLPFFEPRHRTLQERLAAWGGRFDDLTAQGESGDVDGAGREAIRICSGLGLCRLLVPREFGGEGWDLRSVCLARETLAFASGLADGVYAVQGLGTMPVALGGSRDVAEPFLAQIASGQQIAAFALTEAEAGSDAAALSTRAVRDGDEYIIDGAKTFISNAQIASAFTVFARTSDGPKRSVTAFLVDAATPGLTVSRRQEITAPHPIGELELKGCRVDASRRLGNEGDGMRLALATLDFFRTSVGAAACGFAARAIYETRGRVTARKQFGTLLSEFQLTQAALAEMATDLDAARLLVYRAAWMKDHGAERLTREAAMAKLFATEAAQRIVDRAVQLHGGRGVERGSVVERLYREVRATRIYEGTSEIQKLVIAREILKAQS